MEKKEKLEKLYKYTDVSGAKEILKNNTILMKTPDQFNDPSDCDFAYREEELEEGIKLIQEYYFLMLIKSTMNNKNVKKNNQLNRLIGCAKGAIIAHNITITKTHEFESNPLFRKMITPYIESSEEYKRKKEKELISFRKRINEIFVKTQKDIYIGCFSKEPDSNLMWSHYSDKLRGVCIEWLISRPVDSDIVFDVIYSKDKPIIDFYKFVKILLGYKYLDKELDEKDKRIIENLKKIIITKGLEWSYEKEVRFVLHKSNLTSGIAEEIGDGQALYKMATPPRRVLLGEKITQEDERDIRKLCLKYPNCEIVKIRHGKDKYCIEI